MNICEDHLQLFVKFLSFPYLPWCLFAHRKLVNFFHPRKKYSCPAVGLSFSVTSIWGYWDVAASIFIIFWHEEILVSSIPAIPADTYKAL